LQKLLYLDNFLLPSNISSRPAVKEQFEKFLSTEESPKESALQRENSQYL
jgi:hypothetical protein